MAFSPEGCIENHSLILSFSVRREAAFHPWNERSPTRKELTTWKPGPLCGAARHPAEAGSERRRVQPTAAKQRAERE